MKFLKFFAAIFSTASLMAKGYHSLTIDNQLVIIANDCYTRIAIGSILPSKEIAASVTAATVTECEDECSRKRSTCEIFSFGISSKGNASCLLGTRIPDPDELETNTDYDIYIRQQSSPRCMPDRLYKLGSGDRNPTIFNGNKPAGDGDRDKESGKNDTSRGPKPGNRPIGQVSIPRPGGLGVAAIPEAENYGNRHDHRNHPGYTHAVGLIPSLSPGYPGVNGGPIFDVDNPNGAINYAGTNHYGDDVRGGGYGVSPGSHGIRGNENFNNGDFYHPVSHGILHDGDRGDYYSHGVIESGNRYGISVYEAPDTVCKHDHNI